MPEAETLLELQRLDSSADAARKRCAELPERAALREQEAEAAALAAARADADERRRVLGGQLREIEAAVADLAAKAGEVEHSLYSGGTTALRELGALQDELRDVKRRQGEREEAELVVMEQEEQLDAEIAELGARAAAIEVRSAELRRAIAAEEARTDAEIAVIAAERALVTPQIAPPLLAEYEKLRAVPRLGGRAAARLQGETCGGCSVSLPIVVASRIRREPAETAHCPRCGRILVP